MKLLFLQIATFADNQHMIQRTDVLKKKDFTGNKSHFSFACINF